MMIKLRSDHPLVMNFKRDARRRAEFYGVMSKDIVHIRVVTKP
jgi:hypothetical protein